MDPISWLVSLVIRLLVMVTRELVRYLWFRAVRYLFAIGAYTATAFILLLLSLFTLVVLLLLIWRPGEEREKTGDGEGR